MEIWREFAAFGSDWGYVLGTVGVALLVEVLVLRRSSQGGGPLLRFADGASQLTGLPGWAAGPLVVGLGFVLPTAYLGFFWDVAWHIDIGRDEFLMSPPHTFLLLGTTGIGVVGAYAVYLATRTAPDAVGWQVRRWRVPLGAAGMLAAGGLAVFGFWIDEFWHAIYGLDVTMWSPPHLTMISAAVFSPFPLWLLVTEAERVDGRAGPRHARLRRHLTGFFGGALLVALSAWQLEFDLAVPQWQQLFQPLLIALTAGVGFTAMRTILGRGGALIACGWFLGIRLLGMVVTTEVWGLSQPRFPLYLAAAIAVEVAFLLTRGRTPLVRSLAAGLGVGTVGLAGEWAWMQVFGYHPWQPGLFPGFLLATLAAVAGAVLGGAYGNVAAHRPSGVRWRAVSVSVVVLLVCAAVPLPRNAPEADVRVLTEPAGDGRVDVVVEVDPPDLAVGADRWEIMAWQGDGRELATLVPTDTPGRYVAETSVPVGGTWKTMVRFASGDQLGAVPIALPADPEIDAPEIPLLEVREQAFVAEQELMLREAQEGPWWPGFFGTILIAIVIFGMLGLVLASVVAADRRRRAAGRSERSPLAGRRIVVTGAAGGIGRATLDALRGHGAEVVGIDLVSDRDDVLRADVTDPAAVAGAVDAAVARLGGLDAVVVNAGVGDAQLASAAPDADAHRVVEVNLWGSWRTVAAAVPHLSAGGHVVGITSGLARAVVPYTAAYSASKRGFAAHLDVLRLELTLDDRDVAVTEVTPAYIRTAIHDAPGRHGASLDGLTHAEEVDDAVAAIVAALETRRRWLGSSPRTTFEVWAAQHLPVITAAVIARRARRIDRLRPRPDFAPAATSHGDVAPAGTTASPVADARTDDARADDARTADTDRSRT
ncbi:SDR family oxidoreductase [Nitriliruptoraceae bacterium ZYF776]|nr:SDR family oxidoreductase [Profundirhabdus halotolerans]